MKIILFILCSTLISLVSCNNDPGSNPYAPAGGVMLDLLFVDEVGNHLANKLPLIEKVVDMSLPSPNCAYVDTTSYRLDVMVNGQRFDTKERVPIPCEVNLVSGRFELVTQANMAGYFDKDTSNGDSIYVYKVVFYCPALYGNESEHTFVLERKRSNAGLTNNCERLFYDGKLIAADEKGAQPPGPDEPFVIVVPQK